MEGKGGQVNERVGTHHQVGRTVEEGTVEEGTAGVGTVETGIEQAGIEQVDIERVDIDLGFVEGIG